MDTPDSSKNFAFFCQIISGRLEKMTILLPWHNMTSRQKKKKNYHSLLDKKSRLLLKVNNLIFNQLEIIFALLHVHVAYFLYIIYTLRIQLPMRCEIEYHSDWIQQYVIKFISDLRQVDGFLLAPWLPPIKLASGKI